MAEMLLLNPAPRKRRRAGSKHASPAQRRARAAFAAAARARAHNPARRRRRHNPISAVRRVKRRVMSHATNPIRHRRRRNPIGHGAKLSVSSFMTMFKDAAVGGAGAVGMDMLMGYINPKLPASLRTDPTKIGVGDAVKAVGTVVIGKLLSKPTRGLSQKAALGALTTQFRDIISSMVPTTMAVGYYSPAHVTQGAQRVNSAQSGVGAYTQGHTPLLSAYNAPGAPNPLLSGMRRSARVREGHIR